MNCRAHHRDVVRRAAERVADLPSVVAADVVAPDATPADRFELEIVTDTPLPPRVLRTLADHGLALSDASVQGSPAHTVSRAHASSAD